MPLTGPSLWTHIGGAEGQRLPLLGSLGQCHWGHWVYSMYCTSSLQLFPPHILEIWSATVVNGLRDQTVTIWSPALVQKGSPQGTCMCTRNLHKDQLWLFLENNTLCSQLEDRPLPWPRLETSTLKCKVLVTIASPAPEGDPTHSKSSKKTQAVPGWGLVHVHSQLCSLGCL